MADLKLQITGRKSQITAGTAVLHFLTTDFSDNADETCRTLSVKSVLTVVGCTTLLLLVLVESVRGIALRSWCGLKLSTRLSPRNHHN